jgi:hypothetical protein
MSLLEKVNKVIQYCNTIGQVSNDVITQWNTVMEWVLNDGLTDNVNNKLDLMASDGSLASLISTQILGDVSKLTTNTKLTIVDAVNEVNSISTKCENDINLALGTGYLGEKYPKLLGEIDDTERYIRALNDLTSNGGGKLILPNKPITISSNIKLDPQNGSIIIDGSGNSKIIVACDLNSYGLTIGQTCYTQKNTDLNRNVTIQNVEFESSGTPKGGVFVEPGSFMPILKNVKFKGFKGTGACVYVYNDGYNNPTLNKYGWVDNTTLENVVCENVKHGIWFVGNVDRSSETGQNIVENTFSQTKLKNCFVQVTEIGGHAYHFEGSFARSVFEAPISFMEGDALNDVNTNKQNATSYHYFLKGTFQGATFQSLGAEGGGYVVRLDSSMLPDSYGDNTSLDTLGQWIGCGWLNIPDSTKQLLKIVDAPIKQSLVFIDSVNSIRKYRRDNQLNEVSGILNFIGDTTQNSGYQTITVTLPTPMLEIYDIQSTISLDGVDTQANKALYAERVDSYGVDSIATVNKTNTIDNSSYLKYTTVTFYIKVNTNTSQGVKMRYSIKGRIPSKWDYYYGIN